jgi:hypothetical protein
MSNKRNRKLPTPVMVALIPAISAVLVALIALIGSFVDRPGSPVVVNVNIPTENTPTPTLTPSPIFSTPALDQNNHAPLILNIQSQLVQTVGWDNGGLATEYDIYFYDVDGDAYAVKYKVTNSSTPGIVLADGAITSNSDMQMAGTVESLNGIVCETHWRTFFTGYTVMVSVSIVDKSGNQSNSFPLEFSCSGWQ